MKWRSIVIALISTHVLSAQQYLTLEQAINVALTNSHAIAVARNDAGQAANIARPGNAGMLPYIGLVGGTNYSLNNTDIEFATGNTINQDGAQSVAYNASLQLNYVLFNGLANLNTLRQLTELKQIADVNLRYTTELTLVEVIANYYEVARLMQIKRVNEESIGISEDRYARAKLRTDLGSGSRLDLLNAEVNLNADSVSYFRTLTELENAKRNLMVSLSLEPTTAFEVDTVLSFQNGIVLEELKQSALADNSLLAVARAQQRASSYGLKAAQGRYMPELSLGGAYNYNAQENEANFTKSLQINGFGLNATLRWDLFTGQQRQTAMRNAQLEVQTSHEIAENTRKQILRDLENAYNVYVNALFVMQKEQRNVLTNRLNFQRTEELFNLGQLTGTQFREAQLNLIQSESNYSNARYLAKIAEVELYRIAGLLLGSN